MDTLLIFVIAIGLAMDCFAVAISNSSISGEVRPGVPLKLAIAFAFAHLVLVFAGHRLGAVLQSMFAGHEYLVAMFILFFIGSKMIMDARKRKPQSKVFDINEIRVIIVLSIATGMDTFLAGIAMGIIGLGFYLAGLLVTVSVFVFTLAGIAGGKNLGMAFSKRIAITGGVFLLMAAVKVLVIW